MVAEAALVYPKVPVLSPKGEVIFPSWEIPRRTSKVLERMSLNTKAAPPLPPQPPRRDKGEHQALRGKEEEEGTRD